MNAELLMQIIFGVITLVGIGVTIGMLRSIYLTKKEHEEICDKRQDAILENRKAVWDKINQIYDWMITGVIQINRK